MAFRDKAQRPDISALVAMAEELIATSQELTAHARNAVECSRRVRAEAQNRRAEDVMTG
jgi:hypothetical protein